MKKGAAMLTKTATCVAVLGLTAVLSVPTAMAQDVTPSSSATETTQSSGRPSTIKIKQNILQKRLALLERQIDDARRCIANASNPTLARDTEGNLNRVPKTDLVNCTRELNRLLYELSSLQRTVAQLSVEAQAASAAIQRRLQQQRTKKILDAVSGQ
jgi:hypothetical protein